MPAMKTTQQMRDELLLRGRKEVLPFEKDSTQMPIPSTFGGLRTAGRLFHGGTYQGPIADKQGAIVGGRPATSFTRNPYEALEYASQPGGKVVSVSQKGLKIYRGGNPDLDKAYMTQGAQAVARAGYDGVDVRALTGGGYNEVVVWNHEKVKDVHTAPVETRMEGMALAQPFQRESSKRTPTQVVYHGSPHGPIVGQPKLAPHDETGIPGFSVSREPETAHGYAYDILRRHEVEDPNPSLTKFVLHGKVQDYSKFLDDLENHYGTKETSYQDLLNYAKKQGIVGLDHTKNLGIDEISVLFPDALQRPKVLLAAGGSVQQMRDELLLKGLSGGGEVKAPVTPTGFYSPLEEAALRIQRKVGNAQAFMNDLRSVPKEHLQHAGVDKLLTSRPTITREELQQHVARAAPKVEVKVLGESMPGRDLDRWLDNWADKNPDTRTAAAINRGMAWEDIAEAAKAEGKQVVHRLIDNQENPARHAQWQLPGGENYREVLLTLPVRAGNSRGWQDYRDELISKGLSEVEADEVRRWGVGARPDTLNAAAIQKASQLMGDAWMNQYRSVLTQPNRRAPVTENIYRSTHWDEPNVLAHFRINDRTDKDGKKVLFVEEIQSDWGQEGKKRGFASPETKRIAGTAVPDEFGGWKVQWDDGTFSGGYNEASARAKAAEGKSNTRVGVPAAPFVTKTNDWVNLALKHILKIAAEEGHDRVAFVKGEQAAERFGLDKHFSRVAARPTPTGGYQLQTILKDGSREDSVDVPPNKLHEYVGEDLAKKIHGQGGGVFEGGDLKMPQMGMRKFYDELVPQQAHALVKKFGGQGIKPIPLPTPPKVDPYKGLSIEPDDGKFAVTLDGHVIEQYPSEAEAKEGMRYIDPGFWRGEIEAGGFRRINRPPEEYQGFDITPQMRQQILKPMSYKVGGVVPAMDAMRLQVWDKRRGR